MNYDFPKMADNPTSRFQICYKRLDTLDVYNSGKKLDWYETDISIEYHINKIILKNLFFQIIILWYYDSSDIYFKCKIVVNNWCKYYYEQMYGRYHLYHSYRNESYLYSEGFYDKVETKRLNYCLAAYKFDDNTTLLFCSMGKIRREILISKDNIRARNMPYSYIESVLYITHHKDAHFKYGLDDEYDKIPEEILKRFKVVCFKSDNIKSAKSAKSH